MNSEILSIGLTENEQRFLRSSHLFLAYLIGIDASSSVNNNSSNNSSGDSRFNSSGSSSEVLKYRLSQLHGSGELNAKQQELLEIYAFMSAAPTTLSLWKDFRKYVQKSTEKLWDFCEGDNASSLEDFLRQQPNYFDISATQSIYFTGIQQGRSEFNNNQKALVDNYTAIHYACSLGNAMTLKCLHGFRCNVKAVTSFGRTALHLASLRGSKECVSYILLNDLCDIDAMDHARCTALHYAAMHGFSEIVSLLLSENADIRIINENGHRAEDTVSEFATFDVFQQFKRKKKKIIVAGCCSSRRKSGLRGSLVENQVLTVAAPAGRGGAEGTSDEKVQDKDEAEENEEFVSSRSSNSSSNSSKEQQRDYYQKYAIGKRVVRAGRPDVIKRLLARNQSRKLERHSVLKSSLMVESDSRRRAAGNARNNGGKQKNNNDNNDSYYEDFIDDNIVSENHLKISDFEFVKELGEGGQGSVLLVKHKSSNRLYALKVQTKEMVLKNQMEKYVLAERATLERVKGHPFFCEIQFAFQDVDRLFLGLEFIRGEDLKKVLYRCDVLEESIAKKFIAEIVVALEILHSKGIIYRDLKPQNVMVCRDGHVKLIDFGLVHMNMHSKRARATSFCGTPAYLAPEMAKKEPHTFTLDWYSVGLLATEMLAGYNPFTDSVSVCEDIIDNVINNQFEKPQEVSDLAWDFISKCMEKDPKKRLGKHGAHEIRNHSWFADLNWTSVKQKELVIPVMALDEQDQYERQIRRQRENIESESFEEIEVGSSEVSGSSRSSYRKNNHEESKVSESSSSIFEIVREADDDDDDEKEIAFGKTKRNNNDHGKEVLASEKREKKINQPIGNLHPYFYNWSFY